MPLLRKILHDLMDSPVFDPFVLVGGTSLSLRLGHRKSADIDLFTNAPYGSLDFSIFIEFFRKNYPYFDCTNTTSIVGPGRSYYVGNSANENIKVDLYYHDAITDPAEIVDGIRIASLADVTSMKIDVISRGGRKKDFWDLHELLKTYTIPEMLELHQQRNEYTHDRKSIIANLSNFTMADEDIDPVCLKHKEWELIKLDFVELAETMNAK
ncbi:MAG: nucleotidyl transferase AbiEii/AbiGii toxin family protein [Bacteroidota bacterium]|nr:nucleotidyl transferase AbiEii/AbiGii toxin family protein [Bacteroidota bacterium]